MLVLLVQVVTDPSVLSAMGLMATSIGSASAMMYSGTVVLLIVAWSAVIHDVDGRPFHNLAFISLVHCNL